jgi:hypothetical protein
VSCILFIVLLDRMIHVFYVLLVGECWHSCGAGSYLIYTVVDCSVLRMSALSSSELGHVLIKRSLKEVRIILIGGIVCVDLSLFHLT